MNTRGRRRWFSERVFSNGELAAEDHRRHPDAPSIGRDLPVVRHGRTLHCAHGTRLLVLRIEREHLVHDFRVFVPYLRAVFVAD